MASRASRKGTITMGLEEIDLIDGRNFVPVYPTSGSVSSESKRRSTGTRTVCTERRILGRDRLRGLRHCESGLGALLVGQALQPLRRHGRRPARAAADDDAEHDPTCTPLPQTGQQGLHSQAGARPRAPDCCYADGIIDAVCERGTATSSRRSRRTSLLVNRRVARRPQEDAASLRLVEPNDRSEDPSTRSRGSIRERRMAVFSYAEELAASAASPRAKTSSRC